MKFGKQLQKAIDASHQLCEASAWLEYKLLKKLLKRINASPDADKKAQHPNTIAESEESRAFFVKLRYELAKVEYCYVQLKSQTIHDLQLVANSKNHTESDYLSQLSSMHMTLVLLENYCVLNYTGFTKILKKHDKVTGYATRDRYMLKMVNVNMFTNHDWISVALQQIEDIVSTFGTQNMKFSQLSHHLRLAAAGEPSASDTNDDSEVNDGDEMQEKKQYPARQSQSQPLSNGFRHPLDHYRSQRDELGMGLN